MAQEKEYFAFISYQRKDEEWADRLRNKLEHYRLPSSVRKQDASLPKEIRPIFRDALELAGGVLAKEIETALQNSKFLIVICSLNSAKSPWVNKEIQTFIDLGREDRIIPFIIDGTPFSDNNDTECFPPALRSLKGEKELLGININELSRNAASIKVVARMFGLKFDTLWQRYEREKIRKRWMMTGGAMLLALLGLIVGGYFVKQNKTIERQNTRLEEERYNILKANASLNMSLIKTYLSQSRPEMSLVVLNDIEHHIDFLDSVQCTDLNNIKRSICDSILTSTALLVDISDTIEKETLDYCILFENSNIVDFQYVEDKQVLYIHNKEENKIDTIIGDPDLNLVTNCGLTFIAIYTFADGGNFSHNLDVVYTPDKEGIRIYSLKSGRIESFVSCWSWFSWMTYPMGLSSNGKSLIYHEGYRAFEGTWYMNFEKRQRICLEASYTNSYDFAQSSFSPDDKYFHLYYPERKEIVVYSAQSLNAIHVFRYEDCDSVFWNDSSNICISSRGKIYSWKLLDNKKNFIFNVVSFANGVNISNKYAAVACNDGKTYVWDLLEGKMIFAKDILDAPKDVAFTKDGKQLWVISGYNCINTIDLKSKIVKSIYVENKEEGPPHPWSAYLYMTADGCYCISRCYYGNQYTVFDIRGNIIKTGIGFDGYIKKHPNDILSEFVLPEEFDYDPELSDRSKPELTARRISSDGEMFIEGYSNGVIKIASMKEKIIIDSLIANYNKALK